MKRSFSLLFALLLLLLLITSCLTVEKKEYTFRMKDEKSGTLTIKFINLMSMKDDTADISESDYGEFRILTSTGISWNRNTNLPQLKAKEFLRKTASYAGR